jgi:PKD repeat protein
LDVANGCAMDTWTGEVYVCDPIHNADFTWSPPTPVASEAVSFTGTAAGSGPFSYGWDFGDGSMGSGEYAYHAYAMAGTYTVTMTAAGSCGEPQIVTHTITIAPVCVEPDGADFTWAPITPTAEAMVSFSGTLTTGSGPLTWNWNFGDGATGSGQSADHTFAAAGDYSVVLTVSNDCGITTVGYDITVSMPLLFVYLPVVTTMP